MAGEAGKQVVRVVKVRRRTLEDLIEMRCEDCNTIFYVNPRKRRLHVFCPSCGRKIQLDTEYAKKKKEELLGKKSGKK